MLHKPFCNCFNCRIIRRATTELYPDMLEKDLWAKIRDNLDLDWMERVEHKTAPGWPDVHYAHKLPNTSGWLELKVTAKLPTVMPYRPAQAPWLYKYWEAGGNCFTLLCCEDDQRIRLWPGGEAFELLKENGPKEIGPILNVRMDGSGWQALKDCLLSFA